MKRHISELRPTQFALGMIEVDSKTQKLRKMKEKEIEEYLESHPVPVVLCRDGQAHVIDHHHLVRACWEVGIEKVVTKVEADLSKLSTREFWEEMHRRQWVHLYDQFGKGPHEPFDLPLSVRGLADDLYRSLAWAVREGGGYSKNETPFSEFKWADFLRKKLRVERTDEGFRRAVDEAMRLARTAEASHLPGYLQRGSK